MALRPKKGMRAVVVDLDHAWPKSNLEVGGCKHDVYSEDAAALASGTLELVECAKCSCWIMSRALLDALVEDRREFDEV